MIISVAEKLPAASRNTIVFAVFKLVAVVAEFATLPAVEIVLSLLSVIAALGEISALITNDEVRLPDESLCTTPVGVSPLILTMPVGLIDMRSTPAVSKERVSATEAEMPV